MNYEPNDHNSYYPRSSLQTAQVLRCIAQSLLAAAEEMERSRHQLMSNKPSEPDEPSEPSENLEAYKL